MFIPTKNAPPQPPTTTHTLGAELTASKYQVRPEPPNPTLTHLPTGSPCWRSKCVFFWGGGKLTSRQ